MPSPEIRPRTTKPRPHRSARWWRTTARTSPRPRSGLEAARDERAKRAPKPGARRVRRAGPRLRAACLRFVAACFGLWRPPDFGAEAADVWRFVEVVTAATTVTSASRVTAVSQMLHGLTGCGAGPPGGCDRSPNPHHGPAARPERSEGARLPQPVDV